MFPTNTRICSSFNILTFLPLGLGLSLLHTVLRLIDPLPLGDRKIAVVATVVDQEDDDTHEDQNNDPQQPIALYTRNHPPLPLCTMTVRSPSSSPPADPEAHPVSA